MPNQNSLQFPGNALPRWVALLALLGLCSLLLTATTSSQQEGDSTRRLWDKQFEEARANARGQGTKPKPAPSPAKPGAPAAAVAGDELLGLTFWRLRPATSDNTGQPRLSVEQRGQGTKSYRLERADIETPFQAGEMVRLSVETTRAGNRYLYVINREVYADQMTGDPYLIFPARTTPAGGNVIAAGKLVYVPAQGDPLPYFTLQRKRPDHVGEMLTLILSPEPLPLAELPESGAPLKLDAALVKQWEQQWGSPTERREARGGVGKEWTKAEQAAERGQTALAQGNPLPQAIYQMKNKAGGRVLMRVLLKIAPLAQDIAEMEKNKPELVIQLGHSEAVTSVAFSPDGQLVLTGSKDKTARLWDAAGGQELRRFVGHSASVQAVGFSPDGLTLLTGSEDTTARLWDVMSGKELHRFAGHSHWVVSVAFSPDGRLALTGSTDRTARLWDLASGQELRRFKSDDIKSMTRRATANIEEAIYGASLQGLRRLGKYSNNITLALFSPDGRLVLIGRGNIARLCDAISGRELQRFVGHSSLVYAVAFSSNGRKVLTGAEDATVRLWDSTTGKELQRFIGHLSPVSAVAISPDEQIVAAGSENGGMLLWDAMTGKELRKFWDEVTSIKFSPDGKKVLWGKGDSARLWDLTSRQVLNFWRHLSTPSPGAWVLDWRAVLANALPGTTLQWNAMSGKEPLLFVGELGKLRGITALAFSPDGKLALIAEENGTAHLWDVASKRELQRFIAHSERITAVALSPDGRIVLARSDDSFIGTVCFWDAITGKKLGHLFCFLDGSWIVVTPDGRFDTNNFEELDKRSHWIVPDDPLHALPLELFMRDYYEPRLMTRLLAGELLRPIPDLAKLNRAQPQVQITNIRLQEDKPRSPDWVVNASLIITVEVVGTTNSLIRDGKRVRIESGVFDLSLFRDGQLVGYAPEQDGPIKLESGKATITFKDIKLPRRIYLPQVEFSAYAFNVDRVKSETARQTYVLPRPLPAVKGRAYVIAVGVNAYENAALDLSFAANDARRLQGVLTERLKATGEYEEVVPITLLSDYEWKDGRRAITAAQATKGNVHAVLDLLAGRPVDPARLAGIANADRLRQARPEDLVIISFASHGYADEAGRFYFVTYDTGAGTEREITPAILQRSISSDELSRWLRDVDAGELAMIVDACQSAAAVEGEGFKPGPMGSRGLGQLAYDKGMRILAATQADNAALEHGLIRQGLLTYALVRDGIELARADFKPEDKTITLGEWLSYALDRVPQLFAEVNSGQVRSSGSSAPGAVDAPKIVLLPPKDGPANRAGSARLLMQGKPVGAAGKLTLAEEQIQRPALFDYARKRRDVILLQK